MWRLFLVDFVRLRILCQAAKMPISVAEIVAKLNRHDYRLSPGKVNPVLRNLEEASCLTGSSVKAPKAVHGHAHGAEDSGGCQGKATSIGV